MKKLERDHLNRKLLDGESQRYKTVNGERVRDQYMFSYIDADGIRRWVYSWRLVETDKTPAGKKQTPALRTLEKEIKAKLNLGIKVYDGAKLSLNDCFDSYMAGKSNLKEGTKANYVYSYNHFVRPTFGNRKIASIDRDDVSRFYVDLVENQGMQLNTLVNIHTLVHPAFEWAFNKNLIPRNPSSSLIKELKLAYQWENPKRHALTVEQQRVLLDFVKNSKTYRHWLPIITCFLGTGCRAGELTGLTWDDIDFENNVIHIRHNLQYRKFEDGCYFKMSTPKTKTSIRDIPMLSKVKEAFLEEKKRQNRVGTCVDTIDGYSGFVFMERDRTVCHMHTVNRALERIVKAYNEEETALAKEQNREPFLLPHISNHMFRHTFASRLCENEPNVKIAQMILGHANIQTTLDIYVEIGKEPIAMSMGNLDSKIEL